MPRVLASWIGQTDLNAAAGMPNIGVGPIAQALMGREFDEVVLLSNYSKEKSESYLGWARQKTKAPISLERIALTDPTDYAAVYQAADNALRHIKARHLKGRSPLELTLHLSPGTPTMTAISVLLGKTRYPAEFIQSHKDHGVRTNTIPFDIAAEYVDLIPELLRRPDASLEARSAGALPEAPKFGDIEFRCSAMAQVIQQARRVSLRRVSVLIEGESGTGKELLARAIHEEGSRKEKPFVAVNCGALPESLVESLLFGHKKGAFTGADKEVRGHFREADGGTLFLDELGELPLAAQVKLLRVLNDGKVTPVGETKPTPVNVRVIAATNRNLSAECLAGRFRQDLYYRLAVAVLTLPPLRQRQGDLGLLIELLLEKANKTGEKEEPGYRRKVLSTGAKNLLLNHPWPGNVRELENTLMRLTVWTEGPSIGEPEVRAAVMGNAATSPAQSSELPLGNGFSLDSCLADISRAYVVRALKETGKNKSRAAELLGLKSHQSLSNRMRSLGIQG